MEAWSYALMGTLIALSGLLLFFPPKPEPLYRPPGLIPLLLIAGFLLLQVVPLPPFLVRLLSPESYAIYHQTAHAANGGSGWMSLSIYPRATFFELARFLSYLVFYIVAVQLFADHRLLRRTLVALAVFAGLLSLLVIIQFITRQLSYGLVEEKIFWIRPSIHAEGSVGPYVNRNHYAGLMEMIFPLMVCLFVLYRPGSSARTWKLRLRDILLHPRINYYFLFGAAAVLIGTSVFVSLSRGGIMSLTLSMGVLGLWLIKRTKNKKAGLVTAVLFVCIMILTGTNGWDRIFERFGDVYNEAGDLNTGRLHYWRDGRTIIRHFPLTGSGVGTWQYVYPRFRTFPGDRPLEHAHSDYIEFMATGGIVLIGLTAMALLSIVRTCYRTFRRRRRHMAIFLFAGSITAVFSILLHSFVDFNLQVGANGLYFFFVLAVVVSAAHTRFSDSREPTYLPEATVNPWTAAGMALVFFWAMVIVHSGVLRANYNIFDFQGIPLSTDLSPQELDMMGRAYERAAATDPLNPEYHQVCANVWAMLDKGREATDHFQKAVRLAPLDIQTLQDAGRFFARRGDMNAADSILRAAMDFSRNHISAFLHYAAALFENDRETQAMGVLTSTMMDNPENTDACLALMAWVGLPEAQMQQSLPERVQSHQAFADYLASMGRYEAAAAAYRASLDYLDREEVVKKEFFTHVYRFLTDHNLTDKAGEVARLRQKFFPDKKK